MTLDSMTPISSPLQAMILAHQNLTIISLFALNTSPQCLNQSAHPKNLYKQPLQCSVLKNLFIVYHSPCPNRLSTLSPYCSHPVILCHTISLATMWVLVLGIVTQNHFRFSNCLLKDLIATVTTTNITATKQKIGHDTRHRRDQGVTQVFCLRRKITDRQKMTLRGSKHFRPYRGSIYYQMKIAIASKCQLAPDDTPQSALCQMRCRIK